MEVNIAKLLCMAALISLVIALRGAIKKDLPLSLLEQVKARRKDLQARITRRSIPTLCWRHAKVNKLQLGQMAAVTGEDRCEMCQTTKKA